MPQSDKPCRPTGTGISLGQLPELLGYHIRVAQIATFRDFDRHLKGHRISPTLYGALTVIEANPGLKQSELAHAVQLDRSTVVSVVDTLQRRGLVARRRLDGDRRANAVVLTAKGGQLLSEIKPLVAEHETQLAARLSKRDRARLIELLERVVPEHNQGQ
jgi:DNA-binding MarR family transcriptional regulator